MDIVKFLSICNPFSDYHAIKDFEQIKDTKVRVLIGTVTAAVAIVTFGLLSVFTFRSLVNKYIFSASPLSQETNANPSLQRGAIKTSVKGKEKLFSNAQSDIMLEASQATPLIKAVAHNDKQMVSKLLKEGANINDPDLEGRLPIHWAAQEGVSIEIFQCVIPPDINIKDNLGMTALHYAASRNHPHIVDFFIEKNLDLNVPQKEYGSSTPLQKAIFGGHIDIVKQLIPYCEIEKKDDQGCTALHIAAYLNKVEIVKLLLTNGANKNAQNNDGHTPLFFAERNKYPDVIKALKS